MHAKKFLAVFLLFALTVLSAGCHELASDDHDDYGSRSDSYREGFSDGRAYERRRDDRRDSSYERRDRYRRRW
jgi:hypothetical protein